MRGKNEVKLYWDKAEKAIEKGKKEECRRVCEKVDESTVYRKNI